MSAIAHGWHPPMKHAPPLAVAKEFHEADKRVGKWEHPAHKAGGGKVEGLVKALEALASKYAEPTVSKLVVNGSMPGAIGADSAEAISRLAQEKAAGQARHLINPDGVATPLTGVDAVDARAPAGHIIVQQGIGATPHTILDRGGLPQSQAQGLLNRAVATGQLQAPTYADGGSVDSDAPTSGDKATPKSLDLSLVGHAAERALSGLRRFAASVASEGGYGVDSKGHVTPVLVPGMAYETASLPAALEPVESRILNVAGKAAARAPAALQSAPGAGPLLGGLQAARAGLSALQAKYGDDLGPLLNWSRRSGQLADQRDQQIHKAMGVGPATTVPEHLIEGAGHAAGQLPILGDAPALARFGIEDMLPLVRPTLKDYAQSALMYSVPSAHGDKQ